MWFESIRYRRRPKQRLLIELKGYCCSHELMSDQDFTPLVE